MKYQTTQEQYGEPVKITDIRKFAIDLSTALGGSGLAAPDDNAPPASTAKFRVGPDELTVTGNGYQHKGRVTVRIDAPDVRYDDQNMHDKTHRTSEATIDPEARTMVKIAADIKKRVIDASQEALRLQREYAANKAAYRAGIGDHMKTLQASVRGLRVNRRDERALEAQIFSNSGYHYVGATMNHDGTVSIQHVGSMPLDKFVRMVRALNEGES